MGKKDEQIRMQASIAEKQIVLVPEKENMNQEEGIALIQKFMSDYNMAKTEMLTAKLKAMEVAAHFGLTKDLNLQAEW
jgi:hypothetical protein